MKVGILTFHRALNYGAVLQSYALQQVLKDLGYDACIIDYKQKHIEKIYKVFDFEYFLSLFCHPYALYLYLKNINNRKIRNNLFASFRDKYLDIRNFFLEENGIYLIGSDQLWNPRLYSTTFMLDFVPSNKRKVSYAASFGVDNIPIEFKHKHKKLLNRLDEISVREPRAQELVREISGRNSKVVLDPTFLKTPTEWREFANQYSQIQSEYEIPDRYIVSYFIGSSEFNHLDIVKQIARKLGCRIVVIPNKIEDYIADKELTIIYEICSYDFIHLIDNAQLVCTDSFHSVVFSFLLDKDFFIFPRFKEKDKFSQNSRLDNILNLFHLDGHRWADEWLIRLEEHLGHDYAKSYKILDKLRTECKEYLLRLKKMV